MKDNKLNAKNPMNAETLGKQVGKWLTVRVAVTKDFGGKEWEDGKVACEFSDGAVTFVPLVDIVEAVEFAEREPK